MCRSEAFGSPAGIPCMSRIPFAPGVRTLSDNSKQNNTNDTLVEDHWKSDCGTHQDNRLLFNLTYSHCIGIICSITYLPVC